MIKRLILLAALADYPVSGNLFAEAPISAPTAPVVISVADFGAVPNGGKDDRAAILAAVAKGRQTPGAILLIPPGTYNVRSEQGIKLLDDLLTGRANPERVQAIRYPSELIAFDFSDLTNTTIDATGAELVCEGLMEPVGLYRCHNVTLKGLTIRYLRPPSSNGTVTRVDQDSYEVTFDPDGPVGKDFASYSMMAINPVSGRLQIYSCPRSEEIAPNVRRFHSSLDASLKGGRVAFRHAMIFRPAVTINYSEAVTLKQVTILEHGGAGVVCYHDKDIFFDGLRVVPKPGCVCSVAGDSSHFVSCTGEIRMDGCQFSGAGDDACNVHNYYYAIRQERRPKTRDLVVDTGWGNTHHGTVDAPDVGDTLALVDPSTAKELETFTVTGVKIFPKEWRAEVSFDRELPADATSRRMINITRFPRVTIRNCSVVNQRARGFLLKTGPVLIENCLFICTTGHAIQLGDEMAWIEGHSAHDVVIRNNRFINCGYGEGNFNNATCVDVFSNASRPMSGLNKHIVIEDNLCDSPGGHALVVDSSDDVTIRRNRIVGCSEPIYVRYSTRVNAYDNFGAKLTAGPGCQTVPAQEEKSKTNK